MVTSHSLTVRVNYKIGSDFIKVALKDPAPISRRVGSRGALGVFVGTQLTWRVAQNSMFCSIADDLAEFLEFGGAYQSDGDSFERKIGITRADDDGREIGVFGDQLGAVAGQAQAFDGDVVA